MRSKFLIWFIAAGLAVAAIVGLIVMRESYGPAVARQLAAAAAWLDPAGAESKRPHDRDEQRDYVHAESRIELSEQAQQNIGLETINLTPATFARTITIPGIVIEKPGHGDVEVTAPITGVVTQVYPLRGETIEPGDPLFRLRLTHEEIVQAQADLLKTTEELDVVAREIKRLSTFVEGNVEGRNLLEKKYEQQKLEAVQRAQKQALALHGLGDDEVQSILKDRRLLREVLIHAPGAADARRGSAEGVGLEIEKNRSDQAKTSEPGEARQAAAEVPSSNSKPTASGAGAAPQRHSDFLPPRARRFYELETLLVDQGQHVEVGKALCRLGDHSSLYIEGRAFEREAQLLTKAVAQEWKVAASFETGTEKPEIVRELSVAYLSNAVDRDSRAFHFYVELPNDIVRDARSTEGHRFITWKHKPGQRVQLLVPVEQWPNRLVVPADSVVQDGAETYVFQRNGDLFERRTVHVEYQDQRSAVLANDGSVFPGEAIVVTGAYQLHLAIKNKSGSGVDPHAGHNH